MADIDEMLSQYGESPNRPRDDKDLLSRLWDARPWRGFADKQPSMTPLMIALGLLGPRGVGNMSARDLVMARNMRGSGDLPAALPPGMKLPMGRYSGSTGGNVSVGPHGTVTPLSYERFLSENGMTARAPNADADSILRSAYDLYKGNPAAQTPTMPRQTSANVNVRNPGEMRPSLSVVGKEAQPSAPSGRPSTWQERMAAYENYIRGLPESEHPMSYQSFLRMLNGQ